MKLSLPDSLSSLQDLRSLQLELREYKKWLTHTAIKKQVHAGISGQPPELTKPAQELLHSLGSSKDAVTAAGVDELIRALDHFAASAPSLTITLAAPATPGIKQQIVGWCRKNISGQVLVNFQFNSSILGGMVIRYGSHIYDWSFQKEIIANRQKFPEVLRSV